MPSDVTVRCGCGFYGRVTSIQSQDLVAGILASMVGHPDHTLDPPAVPAASEEHDLTASGAELERAAVAVGFVQPVSGGPN